MNDPAAPLDTSSPSEQDADPIARDTLALENLQIFRQLLLPRCLLLAALVGAAGALWPAAVPWWAAAGVCLLVPAALRAAELAYERRLSRRLGGVLVRKS
jgi:hypothetical protein